MNRTSSALSASTQHSRDSMLFGRKKKRGDPLEDRIDCLIGAESRINGDLIFTGGLRVDGHVNGDVSVSRIDAGTLTIGDRGCVQGDVRVSHVIVYGEIRGTVYATGLVDVRPNARILGDVHYGALEMQAGAHIEGHLIKQKPPGTQQ